MAHAMRPSAFQSHLSRERAQRQRPASRPRRQAIDHARAHKEQGIDLLHRRLELAKLFERKLRLDGLQTYAPPRRAPAHATAAPAAPPALPAPPPAAQPARPACQCPTARRSPRTLRPGPSAAIGSLASASASAPSGITAIPRMLAAFIRAASKFALTAIDARNPAAASSSRSRSANCAGGPNSRSVPAMSSTNAHAVLPLVRACSLTIPGARIFDPRRKLRRALQKHRRAAASLSADRFSSRSPSMLSASSRVMPAAAPIRAASRFSEQTHSSGARPSSTTTGSVCQSVRRRSSACAGNSAAHAHA